MKIATTLFCGLFGLSANASFLSGNTLLDRLNGEQYERNFAMGYIAGAFDAGHMIYHCAPPTVTLGQIRDLVKMSLEANPVNRETVADLLVIGSLAKSYPCARKKT